MQLGLARGRQQLGPLGAQPQIVLGGQLDEIDQPPRRAPDVVGIIEPRGETVDETLEHARLPALIHGEVGAVEDEALVQELQHRHLVPCCAIETDMARAVGRVSVHFDRRLQMSDPPRCETGERAVGREGSVERNGQQSVDDLVRDARDRGIECVAVRDPRIAMLESPPQQLERMTGHASLRRERIGVHRAQRSDVAAPRAELAGDRGLIQQSRAIEVIEVVQRVCDVIGNVHDRALDRLLPRRDRGVRAERIIGIGQIDGVHRELVARRSAALTALSAPPRVLEHRRAHGAREVQTDARSVVFVEPRQDAVRLGVSLEAFMKTEAVSGEPIERLLTQMPEWGMPDVMSASGGLNDHRVAPSELFHETTYGPLVAVQMHRDRACDSGDLHRVREPVVHREACARLRDDLGHSREPREVRRETDPLDVHTEVRAAFGTLELVELFVEAAPQSIIRNRHVPILAHPRRSAGNRDRSTDERRGRGAISREWVTVTHSAFALPPNLAEKTDPAVIGHDEARLAEIDLALAAARNDVERRLADARRIDGDGQDAMDRDIAVYGLVAQQTMLRRFAVDLCLGKIVTRDGEALYIGRTGLVSPEGERLLIDWRAPAAEPFFGATHQNSMGLVMRRRFRWKLGRVVDFWDEVFDPDAREHDVALDDQSAFIRSLGATRSSQMRDVLGTIQADQDAIIRADAHDSLVVDGGPGTGKTVVALHRAAYLLYADQRISRRGGGGVLFVGPNDRYLSYVDDVLPSLGEHSVAIATLDRLTVEGESAVPETDSRVGSLKGSARFEEAIARIVRGYERPPAGPVVIPTSWADIEIEPEEWAEAFEAADDGTPHNDAQELVWEELLEIVTAKVTEMPPHLARREFETHTGLREMFDRVWPMLDPAGLVAALWTSRSLLARHAPWLSPNEVDLLQRDDGAAWTLADLPLIDAARDLIGDPVATARRRAHSRALDAERERIENVVGYLSDADEDGEGVALMLGAADMQERLIDDGALPSLPIDELAGPFAHVIVDEAQELTDAEWRMLIRRCPSKSFTIVGDRAQARHGFSQSWAERLGAVGIRRAKISPLSINYRTPSEIMCEAEPVIREAVPDANVPRSVRSSGLPVRRGSVSELRTVLDEWLGSSDDGVACVIGASDVPDVPRVTALTATESKGLEFDLVVLVEPSALGDGVEGAVDRYVAMTRATGQLVILGD